MIGNDVVDLGDPETRSEALNPRFDARVFTSGERSQIERSPSGHETRWMLWACKEAAYKLSKRQDHETIFSPFAFEVSIEEPQRAMISFRGQRICACLSRLGDAVHAVAALTQADLLRVVAEVAAHPSEQSRVVRDLVRKRVAALHAISPDDVTIIDGPDRVPGIRLRGKLHKEAISLSHHGRYVAFAWVPPMGIR